MRWLIQYIRQCFCKHEFKECKGDRFRFESTRDLETGVPIAHQRKTIILYCSKCGYNKWFWGE
ncbi:hypothetical protein LCGC14_1408940 [marine sediment metagenome]|uniref:Uncharacterized protein n=1 Tax=marine sediment metagenome TaxID=412755 RepID=A0A0F9MA71_9ZZZZ